MNQYKSPIEWLNEQFESRKNKNPRYSLRAFSRFLEIPVSRLSDVLTGKRPLTHKAFLRIVAKLEIPAEEQARLEPMIRNWKKYHHVNKYLSKRASGEPSILPDRMELNITEDQMLFVQDLLGCLEKASVTTKKGGIPPKRVTLSLQIGRDSMENPQ